FLSQQYIQHWASCCLTWFPVIAASGILPMFADHISITVMSGIPILFLHLLDKGLSLLFAFHFTDCRDKSGFFLCNLSLSASINRLVTLQHVCHLRIISFFPFYH